MEITTEFDISDEQIRAEARNLPKSFALLQNYTNPFDPEAWIFFTGVAKITLAKKCQVGYTFTNYRRGEMTL